MMRCGDLYPTGGGVRFGSKDDILMPVLKQEFWRRKYSRA
jgi:hypothetical protein